MVKIILFFSLVSSVLALPATSVPPIFLYAHPSDEAVKAEAKKERPRGILDGAESFYATSIGATFQYAQLIQSLAAITQNCNCENEKKFLFNGVFIIAGVTGDLTKRKIIPALYELVKRGMKGLIIGLGRSDTNVEHIFAGALPFLPQPDPEIWGRLLGMTHYFKTSSETEAFNSAKALIDEQTDKLGLTNKRVLYLATAADIYCPMTRQCVEAGLIKKGDSEHLVIYEKPFGNSRSSASALYACIKNYLSPSQIYLVDHYLTKSLIECVPALVPALQVAGFRPKLVNVFFDEKIGIEGRGAFYEKFGIVSDVVQNHVLQVLASFMVGADPAKKADFLRSLTLRYGMLGQYKGYHDEKDVSPDSSVATYAELGLASSLVEVPIALRAGKHLARKATEFQVIFMPPNSFECNQYHSDQQLPATLTLRLSPTEEVVLNIPIKSPYLSAMNGALNLTFSISSEEAYLVLLKRVLAGERTGNVTYEEIEAQWCFAERVAREPLSFIKYVQGFKGGTCAWQYVLPDTLVPFEALALRARTLLS